MKNSTYSESRVVALSLTLPKLDERRLDDILGRMCEEGFDMVSWNASYRIYDMYYNQAYIHIVDAVQGYQVVRHFICECRIRYNCPWEDCRWTEVCQHWICPNGEVVVMAKSRRDTKTAWDGNLWWFGSKMSIKHGDYGYIFDHVCQLYNTRMVWVDGIEQSLYHKLGEYILSCIGRLKENEDNQFKVAFGPIGEWLVKSGHAGLFSKAINDQGIYNEVKRRKAQIKIAFRHGFDIEGLQNLEEWFDYLDDLEADGKDIHNPHYICSMEAMKANTARRHAEEEARRAAEAEARRMAEEERQRRIDEFIAAHPEMDAEDANEAFVQTEWLINREAEVHANNRKRLSHLPEWEEEYAKAKRAYIGLGFTSDDGTIRFHVLNSVEEFYEEAEAMVHCLFYNTCNYFERKDTLILSARDAETDERLATIELNLKTMQISQMKAKYDKIPERFNDLQDSIYSNIGLIKNAKTRMAV